MRKSNGKAVNLTQSDESNKDDAEEGVNYLAFGISYESQHEDSESNSQDKQGVSEIESKEEGDLQNAYNNLFVECTKLKKLNKQHLKKLKEVNLENDQLSFTLTDSLATHNTLMFENHRLIMLIAQWCFTARFDRPLAFLRHDLTASGGLCQDSTDKRPIICFGYQADSSSYHQFAGGVRRQNIIRSRLSRQCNNPMISSSMFHGIVY